MNISIGAVEVRDLLITVLENKLNVIIDPTSVAYEMYPDTTSADYNKWGRIKLIFEIKPKEARPEVTGERRLEV